MSSRNTRTTGAVIDQAPHWCATVSVVGPRRIYPKVVLFIDALWAGEWEANDLAEARQVVATVDLDFYRSIDFPGHAFRSDCYKIWKETNA